MIPNGDDHWKQIDFVSWGYACGMDIYPSVYTRVIWVLAAKGLTGNFR